MLEEKNLYIKHIAIVLLIINCLFSLFLFISKKDEFSENENKYLQKFPTLSLESIKNSSFMEKLESYTSDHFPFRNTFLNIKAQVEINLLNKDENKNVYIGKDDYLIEKYNSISDKNINKITNVLNTFKKNNENVSIQLMLVPTSYTINSDKLPAFTESNRQLMDIDKIYNKLGNIKTINVFPSLLDGKKKFSMFYRLDHHWTTFGAYYAYLSYCKENNIDSLDLSSFNIKTVTDNFNGTLYSKASIYNFPSDEIHILEEKNKNNYEVNYVYSKIVKNSFYEENYLNKKDKYSYFLNNNHPLIEITNKNHVDDESILIIKDSYANSFVPIISNNYQKIYVIDPRFYKYPITEYIRQNNIKTVLFLYNINTLEEDLGIISVK